MNSYSQAAQDHYVITSLKNKLNGYFLEIGSNHPSINNNTFLLETSYNWQGLMIEYDKQFEQLYKINRPRSIYKIADARIINYKEILDANMFPKNMDYLQIDLDVDNKSTLDTLLHLNNTVFDSYKFATVTFEHDIYRGDYFNTRQIARDIFSKRGYELVFPDVAVDWEGNYKQFEDWFLHPDLVDADIINKLKCTESLTLPQITSILSNIRNNIASVITL